MVSEGLSLEQAMSVLRAQRPVCQPNLGFMAELLKIQRDSTSLQQAIANRGENHLIRLSSSDMEEEEEGDAFRADSVDISQDGLLGSLNEGDDSFGEADEEEGDGRDR